ncbi:ATP-binding cassette domain-containing protein [Clostridium sp. NSJ-6]|uniref:ATP-binding cassette domain-containing protein n=1 Tax=Clostridium hominis TaxID=2763036 RepID=A0ABR7D8V9_9CLOT|nr:ATP-binding cassette domain-containing protein [Clostridium hominis]MBC5627824.1 ATP-binding cassette domain-containing protein [Clostridium hominis]MDU2672907.1 ATP-binding cassette domain-containing protein [Clostridium sp.]
MKNYIVKTNKICKKYKSNFVLKDVSINIKKGDIYGLIGKNGAGKTTLMRIIAGLISETSGDLELFEENKSKIKNRKRIGVLIETPAFFDDMDAYNNLEYLRIYKGIPGESCVEEKLKLVGLESVEGKLIKDYSLGMKQKLGLAMALLGDPEFLILDEPTNGLDPVGIVKMRELLKKLNREKGITILISSHILSELSQLSTTYGIMNSGRLVEELSMEELKEKSKMVLEIKVDNREKCTWVLENILSINDYKVLNDNIINIYEDLDKASIITKELAKEDVLISHMVTRGESLEDYVVNVMEGNCNG